MKILLAGGAGFLGSHLAEVLVKLGHSLDVVDNFASGLNSNLDSIIDKIIVFESDVVDFESEEKYDMVFNLASRASRVEWEQHPVDVAISNAIGSKKLIEIALKNDALYVYASSSEVYGDATIVPTPEDYMGCVSTTGTRSPYDEGKRFGDAITKAYERQYGLKNIILRFFNTYGPRMRGDDYYGRVVDRFIRQAINNQPITVYGDGLQTRSFTFVTDTVDGILTAIFLGRSGEVYNIGNDLETRIIDLANLVKEKTMSSSEIVYSPLPENDPFRRAANIDKLRNLGWAPRVTISDGVNEVITNINRSFK